MADDLDDIGGETGADASLTFPQQCSALRKNGFVVIKGFPCKIVEMSTSKTGKHGHAKVHMVAIDIFTGKKYEDICPSTHNMNVPHVKRIDLQVTDIADDGFLTLMDDSGDSREDIRLLENDLGEEIKKKFEDGDQFMVTVLQSMGQEQVIAIKTMT